tara:strand:+ start:8012 stop:8419 length:408 start_codon:yes stop_codon:yes gene_type:complete
LNNKKRFELVIFNELNNDKLLLLKTENIGTVYFYVDKYTMSTVREKLINYNYTTRLFVSKINNKNYFYIYGKKKKNKGVFNEHCKNSVYEYTNFEKFYEHIISVSSNIQNVVLVDDKNLKQIIKKQKRNYDFYNK